MSIYQASLSELNSLSQTIKNAFYTNEVFSYIFCSPDSYNKTAAQYFQFVLKTAFNQGEVFFDETPEKGVILLAENSKKLYSLKEEIKAGGHKLFTQCGVKVALRSLIFKNNLMTLRRLFLPDKHLYIYLLGVNPEEQKKGTGIRLLEFAQKKAKKLGVPLALETMNETLVQFYMKRGFTVKAKHNFKAAKLSLYGMCSE